MSALANRESDPRGTNGSANDRLPAELRRLRQWVAWQLEPNPDRPDKPTKVPYCSPTQRASVSRRDTWRSYREARRLATREGLAGIGFVFRSGDPYVGIDLDGCRNPDTGEVAAWARAIVGDIGSYTELSQSGTGLHIIVKGRLPEGIRHKFDQLPGIGGGKKAAIEIYDSLRYFVVTGRAYKGRRRIKRRQVALDGLVEKYFRRATPGASIDVVERNRHLLDEAVIDRAQALNPAEFHRLFWAGETRPGKTPSESDFQLACMLAEIVGGDVERIERLMRQSALRREKWDEHPTYLAQRTIARAIGAASLAVTAIGDGFDQHYFPSLRAVLDNEDLMRRPTPLVRCVAWPGRVTLFSGREKLAGKSTFLAGAASRVTRGKPFLGKPTCDAPARVLWVSADQEHPGDVAARLKAFGARSADVGLLYPTSPGLVARLTELDEHVREHGSSLVIIDTLSNFARVRDPFASTEWPEVLLRIKQLAFATNAAVILAHHTTKNEPEQYRDSSSIGATVDQLVSIAHVKGLAVTQRRLKTIGRLSGPTELTIELTDRRFIVSPGRGATLHDRVLRYLEKHSRSSQRRIEDSIGGDRQLVREALRELRDDGFVSFESGAHGAHLYSLAGGT